MSDKKESVVEAPQVINDTKDIPTQSILVRGNNASDVAEQVQIVVPSHLLGKTELGFYVHDLANWKYFDLHLGPISPSISNNSVWDFLVQNQKKLPLQIICEQKLHESGCLIFLNKILDTRKIAYCMSNYTNAMFIFNEGILSRGYSTHTDNFPGLERYFALNNN